MAGKNFKYHLLTLAVVAVWGVTFVSTKVLIGAGMHPVAIFFVRFMLAYAGIWVYIGLSGQKARLWYGWKEELVFLVLGISGGSFYFLTENTALAHTQASNVAFLVSSAPLLTAIFTLIYKRFGKSRFAKGLENVRLGWPLAGGTVLALTGMALVVFDGARLQLSALGDLLAIGAALCWAVYSLFMGQMTRDYGTVTATRKVFFYGILTILPFLGGYRSSFSPDILCQGAVWGNLLFLGLVASLVCFIAWNLSMEKLGNVTATNYVYLNPVFTLISAMILLGERMTPLAAIGCAAILGGVIWAGSGGRKDGPQGPEA
ncbi:MAG: DMT family transporter [Bacteroidales bacterium]|nr:DMT family transporter [Bacteroidales bacterium]